MELAPSLPGFLFDPFGSSHPNGLCDPEQGTQFCVVLVSSVQQSDSVMDIYVFFFRFFSIIGYYKILSIVPCVT